MSNNYETAQAELKNLERELVNLPNDFQVAKNTGDFEKLAMLKDRQDKLPNLIYVATVKASKANITKLQDELSLLKTELLQAQETQTARDEQIKVELQMHKSKLFELKNESLALMFNPLRLRDAISAIENRIYTLNKELSAV